jgi:hypothetical protein
MPHSSLSRAVSLSALTFALTLGAMKADAQIGPGGAPTIFQFGPLSPNVTVITSGSTAVLLYSVGGPASTCSIDDGVGTVPCSVSGGQASVNVSPTMTTTYTLTASNSSGTVIAQTTVVVLQLPPNPPGPGLLTTLPGKNFKQVVLPPQYHYTFANTPAFVSTHSGDSGVSFIAPGNNVDARGNMLSTGPAAFKFTLNFGSTSYMFDPNGVRSVFGTTTGTCTQTGQLVTNDYTVINRLGYNPIALAYYVTTTHTIQTAYTNDPNACNPDSSPGNDLYYYSAGSTTQALIKISGALDNNPGEN